VRDETMCVNPAEELSRLFFADNALTEEVVANPDPCDRGPFAGTRLEKKKLT